PHGTRTKRQTKAPACLAESTGLGATEACSLGNGPSLATGDGWARPAPVVHSQRHGKLRLGFLDPMQRAWQRPDKKGVKRDFPLTFSNLGTKCEVGTRDEIQGFDQCAARTQSEPARRGNLIIENSHEKDHHLN